MNGPGSWRNKRLKRRLRADRPVPSQHLVDEVVNRIEASRPASHSTFGRLRLAGVAATVMLMLFAAFGGVGLAASGVSGAASSTAKAVSKLVKPDKATSNTSSRASSTNARQGDDNGRRNGRDDDDDNGRGDDDECEDEDDDGAAEDEYCPPRVTICHVKKNGKEKTLTLRPRAAARHLNNHPRDYPGPCVGNGDDDGDDD